MRQQFQPRHSRAWQARNSQNAWLSMLVDAMEQAALPEMRAVPCDRSVLAAVKLQLGLPATTYPYGSLFSLRN